MNTELSSSLSPVPAYQHPIGRLINAGAAVLSNAELLAVIIRTGTTQEDAVHLTERMLARFDGLHGLAQVNARDLEEFNGLSAGKIAQIVAALELSRRLVTHRASERVRVTSAADAARSVADMSALGQEHVRAILLDSGKRVIATPTIYIGTLDTSVLRVAEVFREAIIRNSPAIVLAHNHPSGDPTPSPEDVEITRTLARAGQMLDITLVDHVIIGRERWVSLREQGFLG